MRKRNAAVTLAAVTLVLCSACRAIQVPNWSDSEVNNDQDHFLDRAESVASEQTHPQHRALKPIPLEYFQYPAQKPQFAVDVATFHGVPNPHSHYKAYPVRPYTGVEKPELGKHKILDQNKEVFRPFQRYTQENVGFNISPVSSNYEIFHPYKAEEPALQALYKDPVLDKIRNDIRHSQHRLQKHENEAGKPDIKDDENLEKFEETDRKKVPEKNILAPYEIHRPQQRPIYYQPPIIPLKYKTRENVLNQKFKHPLNQQYAKIKPMHYRPIKTYIAKLRQHQGAKFDDNRYQYPQLPTPQKLIQPEPEDGYDIFERGKANYLKLRNNVDESINKAVQENHPSTYQKLELQKNGDKTAKKNNVNDDDDDNDDDNDDGNEDEEEEQFVPVKNYAQVRKTETMKHVPKSAAYDDAESLDEMLNAPRLREAIKSTKAQTVYTEEGYEDAAYDHAGEQKHAEEKEGHGGYLKEKELSGGKYKIPSVSANHEDGHGNEYGDETVHGEKWKNDDKQSEEETEAEDYSEDEDDHSIEADIYKEATGSAERNKREKAQNSSIETTTTKQQMDNSARASVEHESVVQLAGNPRPDEEHGVNKRETKFKLPEINLTSTFLSEQEIANLGKIKDQPKQTDIKEKYPYYLENIKQLNRNSPLRYAENLKFIPKKSKGGSEFYDSKSVFECPEVDDDVEALPNKLKESSDEGRNSDYNTKGEADMDQLKKTHRLKGLGDKIDCFKAKFFGENPLDSPFFKEDVIINPEPVTIPNKAAYKLTKRNDPSGSESKLNDVFNNSDTLREKSKLNVFELYEKLQNGQKELQDSLINTNEQLKTKLINVSPFNISIPGQLQWPQQANIYTDVLSNIKKNQNPLLSNTYGNLNGQSMALHTVKSSPPTNASYNYFQNKEDVTKPPISLRKKRSSPFVYEPYKIIRDGQVLDSKKTTTTSNISPLIKQLQSSKVIDTVKKPTPEKEQPVKRNATPRTYKDIGRKDRAQLKGDDISDDRFVDVSIDGRRGEPRYELRPSNHKSQYTPVENKTAMSVDEYMAQKNSNFTSKGDKNETKLSDENVMNIQRTSRQRLGRITSTSSTTETPYYDVNKYLPKMEEFQKISASNTVRRIIRTTTPETVTKKQGDRLQENVDYEEYEDKQKHNIISSTTSKTMVTKRKRPLTTTTSTTTKPLNDDENVTRYPKLRLITRFQSTTETPKIIQKEDVTTEKSKQNVDVEEASKYREKQRKSTKSTIVTDTQSYGGDDQDMMKEEVDAMIRVKQDMREYMPQYEKDDKRQDYKDKAPSDSSETNSESEEDEDDYDSEEEEEDDSEDEEEDENEPEDSEPEQTTSEPVRRTLPQTTEAPTSTTEGRKSKLEQKPVLLTKKKIEIRKELPTNKSSPHVTQFKQAIKEIEIVKESPPSKRIKKPQKNTEALEFYKDDNLAKEINNLGEVEVFKENLDLTQGPKHGGNYRSARIIELQEETTTRRALHGGNLKAAKDDTVASQSENKKLIKADTDTIPTNRRTVDTYANSKSRNEAQRTGIRGRTRPLIDEKTETTSEKTSIHTKNLRTDRGRTRNTNKNAKLIEFSSEQEKDEDDDYKPMHGGNFKSNSRNSDENPRRGNYRNAKIVKSENTDAMPHQRKRTKGSAKDIGNNAAIVLNSFAQAVPILTTTPAYILDPSKRKYYYVDA